MKLDALYTKLEKYVKVTLIYDWGKQEVRPIVNERFLDGHEVIATYSGKVPPEQVYSDIREFKREKKLRFREPDL